jgi:hypothetical protein
MPISDPLRLALGSFSARFTQSANSPDDQHYGMERTIGLDAGPAVLIELEGRTFNNAQVML